MQDEAYNNNINSNKRNYFSGNESATSESNMNNKHFNLKMHKEIRDSSVSSSNEITKKNINTNNSSKIF